jgi:hypothetical protein
MRDRVLANLMLSLFCSSSSSCGSEDASVGPKCDCSVGFIVGSIEREDPSAIPPQHRLPHAIDIHQCGRDIVALLPARGDRAGYQFGGYHA